jgi:hypothetical protein
MQEIPIFGSSKALRGYLPDVLGEPFYNYGMFAASLEIVSFLLQYELKKQKKTPIIIDIYTGTLGHDRYKNIDIKDYIPLLKYPRVGKFLEENDRDKLYYHIWGIRYYGAYFDYFKSHTNVFSFRNLYFHKGGAFFIKSTPKQLKLAIKKRLNTRIKFEFNQGLANKFKYLLTEHPERQFVIVESPFHKTFYDRKKESEYFQVEKYWEEISRFANVTFIKISGNNYPDSYFKDTIHLNLSGAKHFSSELKRILVEKGIIDNSN